MKKYNCFEELHETFSGERVFECEGEIFDLRRMDIFENKTTIKGINVINIERGILIRVYHTDTINQYIYYTI